ncbi:conserved Plasmodium protein, unknown function [Plasmodium knowlesi strain H]|uniref:Uncharacterized protein n=1 Tax=Plasmodium knowlesi (strain H) TaxID=5851 RepID=A0A5K1UCQ0_PLAKH|nr:conserved Plasmodium protein, unknown function [Plasmodium knowlesi strain H]|eukprot:XP_002260069.1 hypothetical protein, conserved in Plasmodium species [Plasmodium knowlesi strain H]
MHAKHKMGEENNHMSKNEEIKAILRRIKNSDNTKDKFGSILKLSRYTSYLHEGEKLKISKCIGVHFISLLLRSDNSFQLFALRLVNSLIAESTEAYLKRCMPFVNAIIFYYCDFVNEWNEKVEVQGRKKEGKGKGEESRTSQTGSAELSPCLSDTEEFPKLDGSNGSDGSEGAGANYNTDGINDIYLECLEYLLKMLPFLNEKEIVDNSFFPREGSNVSFDADMYFLQKKLKKGAHPSLSPRLGGRAQGGLKGFKKLPHQGEKREDFEVEKEVVEEVIKEEVNGEDDVEGDASSMEDTSLNDEDEQEEDDSREERVSLVELLFDALTENIRMVEAMRARIYMNNGEEELPKGKNTPKGSPPPKGELPKGEAHPLDKASQMMIRAREAKFLLNSRNVDMTLLLLNNTFLKLSGSRFVKEYFYLLNKVIETYRQSRVTAMKCQTNLNAYMKKQGCISVLDKRSVYKLYANIIYLFSQVKVQEEKELLYILYSTVYSCLNFSFLSEKCIDILKTPLSYMNVELYLFAEKIMKYMGGEKDKGETYPFEEISSAQIIPLICTNIEHVINFISQEGVDEAGKKISLKGENLPMGELHKIIGKIKRAIEIVIELFKDLKSHIRELNPSCESFKMLKEKFHKQLNSMVHLFCNYLLFENGHYIDDFLSLLELFSIWVDEEKVFLAFPLIMKNVHADRYIHNKQFVTKLFLLILDPTMKNIVHIKILYDIFYKCIFNVVESIQIVQNDIFVKFTPENVPRFLSKDYDLVLPCNIPIDKLNIVPFVYIICEDEYNKRKNDQQFIRNITNILSFSVNFFFHYWNFFLMTPKGQLANSEPYLFEHNYFNACAGHIRTNELEFFLALKVLFTISSLLFLRFDSSVLNTLLDKHPTLFLQVGISSRHVLSFYCPTCTCSYSYCDMQKGGFITALSISFPRPPQDCLIASLLNLKIEVEVGVDTEGEGTLKAEEAIRKSGKRHKYFLQNLELVYLVMYYHPTFVSLLIFRLKQVKKARGEIRFETNKLCKQEKHLSICSFLNRFIETHV